MKSQWDIKSQNFSHYISPRLEQWITILLQTDRKKKWVARQYKNSFDMKSVCRYLRQKPSDPPCLMS